MPKPKKTTKPTLLERAANMMDLPSDTVAGLPRIEIVGCRQFYISNHKGLLEYEESCIAVNGGRVVVRVRGDGLVVKAMNVGDLLIEGKLLSVEFAE